MCVHVRRARVCVCTWSEVEEHLAASLPHCALSQTDVMSAFFKLLHPCPSSHTRLTLILTNLVNI